MAVTVQYLAQVRRAVGQAEEAVDLVTGENLAALIRRLADKHPAAASLLIDETGQPKRSLIYFVDDAIADFAAILPENAVLTILAPMAGGCG